MDQPDRQINASTGKCPSILILTKSTRSYPQRAARDGWTQLVRFYKPSAFFVVNVLSLTFQDIKHSLFKDITEGLCSAPIQWSLTLNLKLKEWVWTMTSVEQGNTRRLVCSSPLPHLWLGSAFFCGAQGSWKQDGLGPRFLWQEGPKCDNHHFLGYEPIGHRQRRKREPSREFLRLVIKKGRKK